MGLEEVRRQHPCFPHPSSEIQTQQIEGEMSAPLPALLNSFLHSHSSPPWGGMMGGEQAARKVQRTSHLFLRKED